MKNRPSARPARRRKPSDVRARLPGNRLSAKVSSRAPNAWKMRAVLSGCPGRSEFLPTPAGCVLGGPEVTQGSGPLLRQVTHREGESTQSTVEVVQRLK